MCSRHHKRAEIPTYGVQRVQAGPEGSSVLCVRRLAETKGKNDRIVRWSGSVCVLCTAQDHDGGHGASHRRIRGRLGSKVRSGESVTIKQRKSWDYKRIVQERRIKKTDTAAVEGDHRETLGRGRGDQKSFIWRLLSRRQTVPWRKLPTEKSEYKTRKKVCQNLTQSKGIRQEGRLESMAGPKQPIDLVKARGRKHLTKAEIEERKREEIKAPSDKVEAPSYLTANQKRKFTKTAKELLTLDLITNLDVDALARLIISMDKYREITEEINRQPVMLTAPYDTGKKDPEGNPVMGEKQVVNGSIERLMIIQDRYFRQCRQGAADFGLTVSSRCRLIVPKAPEVPKDNKFNKFG